MNFSGSWRTVQPLWRCDVELLLFNRGWQVVELRIVLIKCVPPDTRRGMTGLRKKVVLLLCLLVVILSLGSLPLVLTSAKGKPHPVFSSQSTRRGYTPVCVERCRPLQLVSIVSRVSCQRPFWSSQCSNRPMGSARTSQCLSWSEVGSFSSRALWSTLTLAISPASFSGSLL